MRPDLSFVKEKPGKEVSLQALAQPGKQYALYLHGGKKTAIGLVLPKGTYRIEWTNPLTGQTTVWRKNRHKGGPVDLDTPAYDADIALAVTRIN